MSTREKITEKKKMKENERKWKKIECLFRMYIIPFGIRGAAWAALLFHQAREQTFTECALFHSRPDEHPRGSASGPRATCEEKFSGEEI